MENVSFSLFYRTFLLAPLISMRLLILKILCWVESLISIFNFLCKFAVLIYYPVYLSFLLSKKILSCSLRFTKFLILCTLRLIILFLRYLFWFWFLIWFALVVFLTLMLVVMDDFIDFRSSLIFSSNSVHVDVMLMLIIT